MDYANTFPTNLYDPVSYGKPAFSAGALRGNDLDNPALQAARAPAATPSATPCPSWTTR